MGYQAERWGFLAEREGVWITSRCRRSSSICQGSDPEDKWGWEGGNRWLHLSGLRPHRAAKFEWTRHERVQGYGRTIQIAESPYSLRTISLDAVDRDAVVDG